MTDNNNEDIWECFGILLCAIMLGMAFILKPKDFIMYLILLLLVVVLYMTITLFILWVNKKINNNRAKTVGK